MSIRLSAYGFIIGIAIVLCQSLFLSSTKLLKDKYKTSFSFQFLFYFLIGARLYHVIDFWRYYILNPLEILKIYNGGLGIIGGVILSSLYTYFFCKKHKIDTLALYNELFTYLPLGQAIGRWANLTNIEIFGLPTRFGQYVPPTLRPANYAQFQYFHPVWLYESIACFLLYYILLIIPSKYVLGTYLLSYGIIRFILEPYRFDSWQIGDTKVAQLFSILYIIISISIFFYQYVSNKHRPSHRK